MFGYLRCTCKGNLTEEQIQSYWENEVQQIYKYTMDIEKELDKQRKEQEKWPTIDGYWKSVKA